MGAFQLRPNRFVERDIRMSDATAETPTSHTTSLPLRFIPRTAWNSILIGLVLVSAIACAGQRGAGSTDNLGGALVDASAIGILNVSEVMDGDIPSEIRDDFVYKWDEIEKYEAYLDELRTIVVVGSSNGDYSIFRGKIDFEAVRDALDDEDYQEDTYRGQEIWTNPGYESAAVFEKALRSQILAAPMIRWIEDGPSCSEVSGPPSPNPERSRIYLGTRTTWTSTILRSGERPSSSK